MASYGGRGLAVTPAQQFASAARWLSPYIRGTRVREHPKCVLQVNLRSLSDSPITERSRVWLYAELFNLFNLANYCTSYEKDVTDSQFNKPRAFCEGPSNGTNGGVTGHSAFAVPSLHTPMGFAV